MARSVCFVCPHVYGYFNSDHGYTGGGAERQIHLLSTALADSFDASVVVGDYGQPEVEIREGVTLHRAYPLRSRRHALQPVKHFLLLGAAMRRADADVYVHRGAPDNTAFVYQWTRLLRTKFLYHVANDEHLRSYPASFSRPYRWFYGRALRNAAAVVAQNERQQKVLESKYETTAAVVPNAYPMAGDVPGHSEREYVLWVGRIDREQKQPHVFLDIAERMPATAFRLVGPANRERDYPRGIVERARSLDNVTYAGEVTPTEIHEQYRHAIALVNTSAYEGFPNTFLEAWRQATPVVSLWIDPARFLDETASETHAKGSVDRAAGILRRFGTDSDYWRTVGEKSREHFKDHYNIETVAEEYESILRRIVRDG